VDKYFNFIKRNTYRLLYTCTEIKEVEKYMPKSGELIRLICISVLSIFSSICVPFKARGKKRDFPGGPVVRTLCFHFREHGFDPWLGN